MHITSRHGRTAAWIAFPLAVVASGALIATASYAAFSSSTDNAANSWRTGAVSLSDDDQGVALFDVEDLVPGSAGSNCITVTANTTNASTVKLYAADGTDADSLAEHVGLTVERGSLGTPGDCSTFTTTTTVHDGTLAGLMASESFGTGVDAWQPATGTASTTYRFSYDLSEGAPNTVQSSEAGTTFVWEAQTD
ncbi:hypothetical protein DEI96_010785 [Curtobacterium sp. MCLR17_031]|uniref:hypothetical protein n=1 Tax=Curtobacterium sp. MCLR17_031 TaxID=2175622 RepID=UPI000DA97198|nr:hypothetical protein [Curtobacterium sp. MCLR17_031]WIE56663.1 hypothetical protein DEI96_010785 [Curtobacterium sp. MCLR17_031]